MSKEELTIVIQGPINETSLSNIPNYKKFGKVIVSYWDTDEVFEKDPDVTYISNPLPPREEAHGILKDSTFYWAVCSTHYGVQASTTKYTIKVRSDEYFTDLNPFLDALSETEDFVVCGSIFCRSGFEKPYHMGDHIFACKTTTMKSTYQELYDFQNGHKKIPDWARQGPNSAESILGRALANHGDLIKKDKGVEFLNKNEFARKAYPAAAMMIDAHVYLMSFFVVDVNSLGDYKIRWAYANLSWETLKGEKFINHHGINCDNDFSSYYQTLADWFASSALDSNHPFCIYTKEVAEQLSKIKVASGWNQDVLEWKQRFGIVGA